MLQLSVSGLEAFKNRLSSFAQLSGLESELEKSAQVIANRAADNLSQVTSSSAHRALRSSLSVLPGGHAFSWRIGTELKYGAYIEFGTTKTPAHPWLSPALRDEKQSIVENMREKVRLNLKQASSITLSQTFSEI